MGLPGSLANKTSQILLGKAVRYTAALAVVMAMLSSVAPEALRAQSGHLTGKVYGEQSGHVLSGAKVSIPAIGISTLTDRDGRYVLRRVPSGDYDLEVSMLGYEPRQVSVNLGSGQKELPVYLPEAYAGGDRIFGTQARGEQIRAYNRQKQAHQSRSVLGPEQRDRFGDYTVRDALIRVPGVQAGSNREINLRGIGLHSYNVTLDGQRMATTGLGDRSVDLGMFSTDLIDELQVIRVVSPDMDAEALSGVVNLTTYQPVGGPRRLSVHAGGGANTKYAGFTGPDQRASLRYYDTLSEELALSGSLSYLQQSHSREFLGIRYGLADFGDGPVDVLENISPGLRHDTRQSIGGHLQLTYEPSPRAVYHIRGLVNVDNRMITSHTDSFSANGDWISPDTTGLIGNQGIYRHEAREQETATSMYFLKGSGNHYLEGLHIDYSLEWNQSNVDRRSYLFPFARPGLNFSIDHSDRDRPHMTITNQQFILQDGSIDRRFVNFSSMNRTFDHHVANHFSGKFNLQIPFSIGEFKTGTNIQLRNKTGEYDELHLTYMRTPNMTRFIMLDQRDVSLMDDYVMPWLIHTENARVFYNARRPLFTMDENRNRQNSDIWNYESSEYILAGYGMTTLELGRFRLLAGARIEYTIAEYEGYSVLFDLVDNVDPSAPAKSENDYIHVLPNVQLGVALNEYTSVLLAYSNTLARPDYNFLTPFELINVQDSTIFRGNPGLEPVTSQNVDLILERSLHFYGRVEVGVFYRRISDMITASENVINVSAGDFPAFDTVISDEEPNIPVRESSFVNSDDDATVYGVEISYEQSFGFLPGFLGSFGTRMNYTWSESARDLPGREDEVALNFQSPHALNVSLNFTQGRYFAQLSYYWADDNLYRLAEVPQTLAGLSADNEYMDQTQSGWSDLSLTFRFRISNQFRFWADAYNLLGNNHVIYQYDRNIYPVNLEYRGGLGLRAGIRFDF